MRDRILEIGLQEQKFREQQRGEGAGRRSAKEARRKTAKQERAIDRLLAKKKK